MSTETNRSTLAMLFSRQGASTLLVTIAGLAASVLVFFAAYSWEFRSIHEHFDALAADRCDTTKSMFAETGKLIDFMDNVFLVGPKAASPEFSGYVRSLKNFFESDISKQLSVHGVTWVPRVPQSERDAYEKAARAVFDPNYHIHEPQVSDNKNAGKKHSDSYPCYLSLGKTSLRDHLGEDLSLDPAMWKAMQTACDTGEAVAVAPIAMPSNSEGRLGYRVFQPLYAGSNAMSVKERRQACTGFMCLHLDIGAMIDNALKEVKPVGIDFFVYDSTDPKRVLVSRHASRLQSGASSKDQSRDSEEVMTANPAEFFGRKLTLESQSTPVFWAKRTIWQPWVLLCGGLVLTLVMAGHQFSAAVHTNMVEQVVSTRLAAIQKEVAVHQLAESEKFRPGSKS
jgi:hypothetical protein